MQGKTINVVALASNQLLTAAVAATGDIELPVPLSALFAGGITPTLYTSHWGVRGK